MNKKANLALQATTDANKTFLLSDPESLQQINCYILVVGAPNLKAYNFSSQQGNTLEFGLGRFYHSAGTTIELLVPSGASRTITLLGSVSQGTACKELPAGEAPDFQNLSRPVVIAQETRDLPPGDVEILLTANLTTKFFDTSNWFTTTPGAGGSDGNTTPSEPIVISSPTPSVAYSSVSVGQSKSFSVVANSTGALSYQWKINGNVDIALVGSGSSALFTSAASQLGDNLIEVTISNGSTTASHSWLVNVNYFSQACNELLPGNICTLSGVYDIGDNSDPFVEADRLKIAPGMMVKDETEGYFISDISNSVIWYHNRNPTTRSILGLSIPPGKIRVVAGTGISVPATAGIALEKPINVFATPADMAWDSTQQRLFFLEYASGKVWQVDSSGNLTQIFGGGASNSEGVSGVTHQCTNAKGLAFDSGSNYLFISCSGNNRIKKLDLATGLGYTIVGTGTAGSTDGDNITTQVKNVVDLDIDNQGNIYWLESTSGHCTLRVFNRTGSPISYMNSNVNVSSNNSGTIAGGTGCTASNLPAVYGTARFPGPQAMFIRQSGPTIYGFYISFQSGASGHAVLYLNNQATLANIANVGVNSNEASVIWGMINNGGSPTYGNSGLTSKMYKPYGLNLLSSGELLLADSGNYVLQKLNLTSGIVSLDMGGNGTRDGTEGRTPHPADRARLKFPRNSAYDPVNNLLYFGDNPNSGEVRSLDLNTGELQTAIGGGGMADSNDDIAPLDTLISSNSLMGLALYNDQLLYSTFAAGNCRIRNFNRGLSPGSFFNVSVNNQKISTVAINGTCSGTFTENDLALSVGIDGPNALTVDPSGNMYGVLKNQHCVFKIDPGGIITTAAGACGTSGSINNSDLGLARFNSPVFVTSDPSFPINLFVTDGNNNRVSYINFGASTVNIGGATINPNYVNSIATEAAGGKMAGVAAFAQQICYSAGSNLAKVVCIDRDSGVQTLRVGSGTSIAGDSLGFEQENIPANMATLADPQGLSFDGAGNLYILDYKSNNLRKVRRWF